MNLTCYVAGQPLRAGETLPVENPYTGKPIGTVTLAGRPAVEAAVAAAVAFGETPTRWQRFAILDQARQLLEARQEDFARLITSEAGLCIRETRYEVGR